LTASFGMLDAQQINSEQIKSQIDTSGTQLAKNALDRSLSIQQQNTSIDIWNNTFNVAKAFIINNSKNALGVRDSDIINGLNGLEKFNNDVINAIKITRGLSSETDLRNQRTKLASMQQNFLKSPGINKLWTATMILNNKKQAQAVAKALGNRLELIVQSVDKLIQQKINVPAPALPPRVPSAPSRPAPARPEAPKPMIGECVICLEEKEVVKIPCRNNHPNDFICKEDLAAIQRTTNLCPICRQPLLK